MTAGWVALIPAAGWSSNRTDLGLDAEFVRLVTRAFLLDVLDALDALADVTDVIVVGDADVRDDLKGRRVRVVVDSGATTPDLALEVGRRKIAAESPGSGLLVVSPDLPAIRPEDLRTILAQAADAGVVRWDDVVSDRAALVALAPGIDSRISLGAENGTTCASSSVAVPEASLTRVRKWPHLARVLDAGVGRHTEEAWREHCYGVRARFGVMTGHR